jgi:hypothetical protein
MEGAGPVRRGLALCEEAVPIEGASPDGGAGPMWRGLALCGGGWLCWRGMSICVYLGIGCSDRNRAGTLRRLESVQATGSRWNVCGENMR